MEYLDHYKTQMPEDIRDLLQNYVESGLMATLWAREVNEQGIFAHEATKRLEAEEKYMGLVMEWIRSERPAYEDYFIRVALVYQNYVHKGNKNVWEFIRKPTTSLIGETK